MATPGNRQAGPTQVIPATRRRPQPLRVFHGHLPVHAGRSLAPQDGMNRSCIAVVDASRARLFTFDRTHGDSGVHEQLVEQRDLDDRLVPDRDARTDPLDAAFARIVAAEIEALLRASGAHRLILCGSPRMLGELRVAGADLRRQGLLIDELPRDLIGLTVPRLRERLASYSLLPPLPRRAGLQRSA